MSRTVKIYRTDSSTAGTVISIIMHVIVALIITTTAGMPPIMNQGGGGYVEVTADDGRSTGEFQKQNEQLKEEQVNSEVKEPSEELMEKTVSSEKETKTNKPSSPSVINNNPAPGVANSPGRGKYRGFSNGSGDTTGLKQVYSEKSLNVSINYPSGWTFLDQNKNRKLDGVTFWPSDLNMDPPPYVYLEVKEKYLFNASRFKYSEKMRNAIIYYNDPEELENTVTQIFYFRTEGNEDFSLKLSMKGKEAFAAFQPVFFGMIKTFRFGKSWF